MKPSKSRTFVIRLAERVLWTAVEAGLGVLATSTTGLPPGYAVPVAAAAAWLKGKIASRFGDPYDPATLPAGS